MAKKSAKKKDPLEEQVKEDDTLTIADVKQFVLDGKKKREDFLMIADRSWSEIEKRNKRGRLYGGYNLDQRRRWTKFPLWWVTWKIRQPITFARLPVPILKDTQGDDPLGRTACIIGERLTRAILKTFDAFAEFSACVDDFLITNFGFGRVCYRMTQVVEDEKLRLQVLMPEPAQPQMSPEGEPLPQEQAEPIFLTDKGKQVTEGILEDELGPYILTGQQVEIENEEVYFKAGLYNGLIVDPDCTKWAEVTRLAFETEYSYREFKKQFGKTALNTITRGDLEEHRTGRPITVYEYHDKDLREVRWFAETSEDFFQPAQMGAITTADEVKPEYDNSDLYGLSGYFPCVDPLIVNASTKSFWPTSEYFQLNDVLDDIHTIVGRMFLLTKAIRCRFLFDSSIRELKQLIGETGEGGGLGIPNLQQSLIAGKGTLANLVAYFPVNEMITGLNNMYQAYEQRLNMYFQLTGLSDLLRGQTSDVEKTYGERQLEGKFALNRIEPYQRQSQEWVKNNYQLLMELALKMFSDKTLDEYITPQTLDPEDKQRYLPALDILKNNERRRFRVDFETDSTIAINQEWKRKQAVDLANTLTKALESTAKVAETQPELASTELKVLKHLIGEFSDGKLFVDEIQDAIEKVIEKVSKPAPPQPNLELEKLKLDAQATGAEWNFKNLELQTRMQLDYAKLQQKERYDAINTQLEQLRLGIENAASQVEMQTLIQQVQNSIAQGWQELELKKAALFANIQSEVGKQEMEQMRTLLDARVKGHEISLAEAEQQLRQFQAQIMARDNSISLQERIATEHRLQEEHQADMQVRGVDAAASLLDAIKTETPKPAPVSIDLSRTLQVKAPAVQSKKPKKDKNK